MANKRRNIFLYLAIACLVGIIAIFVFGGYLGIYDTVDGTAGEYTQTIGPEFWQGQRPDFQYPYNIGARWGDTVRFRYEINNRRFSGYSADVKVSLWQSGQKVMDLLDSRVTLASFEKATLEWVLTPQDMEKAKLEIGQYTVRITRGGVELGKGIILGYYDDRGAPYSPKPMRPPVPASP